MSVPQKTALTPQPTTLFVAAIVALCCGLPVLWIGWTIASNPSAVVELGGDQFRWMLLARTVGFNALAALVAVLLAAPVAVVLGRGRGFVVGAIWTLVPASLLIPSIVYSYGWAQLLALWGINLEPASPADVARCVFSLAAWLWAVPAELIGLALRRLDANVQQQALLDGALGRITLRQLWPAITASFAIVLVLAMQEFAVYEQTGISVIATEVRTIFDTGGVIANLGTRVASSPGGVESAGFAGPDQAARAAAAIVTGAPLVLAVAILSGLALWMLARSNADGDVDYGPVPRVLQPSRHWTTAAVAVLLVVLAVPVGALVASHSGPRTLGFVLAEYKPQLVGTLVIALTTAVLAAAVALLGCVRKPRTAIVLAVVSFLIGGQFLAIALIRIYNRPWLSWVYNGMPIIVIAYLARFGWLALMAARGTNGPAHRPLRDMAAVDGATPWQTTTRVVWPIAWPTLVASALLVGVLASGEVPATTLLSPLRPPMLVPSLMTWVHTVRYDPMIEASLLLAFVALSMGVLVALLVWIGLRRRLRVGASEARTRKRRGLSLAIVYLLASILVFSSLSCGRSSQPDEIWLDTGVGPSQVVYPRAIAYAATDDSFFVVDRRARVQHVDNKGNFLNDWMMPDQRYGKPTGISVGPDGNVYVADTHYHRVRVYSPGGDFLREWGGNGTGPGQFIWPTDVAWDDDGRVFVAEYGDHDRIQVFDAAGKVLYQIGSFGQADGQFSRPQSIIIDGDTLYVADTCNHRIVVFTTDGKFVRNMGGVGDALGQFRFPYGLVMGKSGELVVTEFGNNRVQWVDKETGRGIRTWGAPGREPGQLAYPWSTAVDKRGRAVIVDAGNNRLQIVE